LTFCSSIFSLNLELFKVTPNLVIEYGIAA
jgi:hypothetical protein